MFAAAFLAISHSGVYTLYDETPIEIIFPSQLSSESSSPFSHPSNVRPNQVTVSLSDYPDCGSPSLLRANQTIQNESIFSLIPKHYLYRDSTQRVCTYPIVQNPIPNSSMVVAGVGWLTTSILTNFFIAFENRWITKCDKSHVRTIP